MILLPPPHILRLQVRATTPIEETYSAEYLLYARLCVTDSEPAPILPTHKADILEVCLTLKYRLWPLEKWNHYQHRAYVPTWQQFDRADNAFSGVLFPVYNISSCSFLFSETTKSVSACPWKLFGNGKGFGRWVCHRSLSFFLIIINKHLSGIYM